MKILKQLFITLATVSVYSSSILKRFSSPEQLFDRKLEFTCQQEEDYKKKMTDILDKVKGKNPEVPLEKNGENYNVKDKKIALVKP